MDPHVTLRDLLDTVLKGDLDGARELAETLKDWLAKGGFSPLAPERSNYNGWKNYETWAVNLWLTNEEAAYHHCRALAAEARQNALSCSQVRDGVWRAEEAPKYLLAAGLKEHLEEGNPIANQASVYNDLVNAALSEVDWQEVAEAFLEE